MRKKITKKYNLGGDIGSILGGLAGTMIPIPGVGNAIGAAAGKAAGNWIGDQFNSKQDPIMQPTQTIIQQPSMVNQSQTMNPYSNTMGYALGGPINNQVPGQQLTEYQGPSHEQGGIPLGNTGNEVEGGEVRMGDFIFSDRIQVPNNKQSFADMAKTIQKKYSNGKGDRIGEKTMMRELAQLAQVQEGLKAEMQQQPQGMQQGPQDGSGPNGQMMAQQGQQQFAAGGSLDGDPTPKDPKKQFTAGSLFAGWRRASHLGTAGNSLSGPSRYYDPNNESFLYKNTHAPSGYSVYSANEVRDGVYMPNTYTPITFSMKIPISKAKRFNRNTGKYNYTSAKPQAQIKSSYLYTPKSLGSFFGGQYIPNVAGIGNNNIGKRVWGTDPVYDEKQSNINISNTLKNINQTPQKTYATGGILDDPPGSNYGTWGNIQRRNRETVNSNNPTVQPENGYGDPWNNIQQENNKSNSTVLPDITFPSGIDDDVPSFNYAQPGKNYNMNSAPQGLPKIGMPQTRYASGNVMNDINNSGKLNQLWDKTKEGLKNVDYDSLSKTGLSTLGGLYDVARGMKGGEFEYYNRLNDVNYRRLDPSRSIQQVNEQGNYARNKIGNIGGQGLGQYLNNVGSVAGNTQKNVANVQAQYDNKNTDIINKGISYNSQIAEKNLKTDMYQNDINARERDTASNDIQHGLTTIGQGFNQQFQDQARRDVQDQTIAMIGNKTAEWVENPTTGKWETVGVEIGTDGKKYYFKPDGKVYDVDGNLIGDRNQVISTGIFNKS